MPSDAARKVLKEALALTDEERLGIASALYESVDEETRNQIVAARRSEVLERLQKVAEGEADEETWKSVRKATRDTLIDISAPKT